MRDIRFLIFRLRIRFCLNQSLKQVGTQGPKNKKKNDKKSVEQTMRKLRKEKHVSNNTVASLTFFSMEYFKPEVCNSVVPPVT